MPMTFREAERLLLEAGYVRVKGGKGSHIKYRKNGVKEFMILTQHGKELSPPVEKSVWRAVRK